MMPLPRLPKALPLPFEGAACAHAAAKLRVCAADYADIDAPP